MIFQKIINQDKKFEKKAQVSLIKERLRTKKLSLAVEKIIDNFCFGDKETNIEIKRELKQKLTEMKL
jgi:hypothetical protein